MNESTYQHKADKYDKQNGSNRISGYFFLNNTVSFLFDQSYHKQNME